MCDPVSEHDSRGGGVYCCRCNTWREGGEGPCPRCGLVHRRRTDAEQPLNPA